MDFREIFENAVSEANEKYPFSDDDEIFRSVKERTRKMNNDNTEIRQLTEIEVPVIEKKKSRVPRVLAGAAAAVALTGAGVVAGNYMGQNNIYISTYSGGAASGSGVYSAVSADMAVHVPVSELAEKTFRFTDTTIQVDFADFDGQYLRVDYTVVSGSTGIFLLEPNGYYITQVNERVGFFELPETEDGKRRYSMTKQYAGFNGTGDTMTLRPALYNETSTERIDGILAEISNTTDPYISQPIFEDEDREIADKVHLSMFWLSNNVLEANIAYFDGCEFALPEVYMLSEDGTKYPLKGCYGNGYTTYNEDGESFNMDKAYFISENPDIPPLTGMVAVVMNEVRFDVTAEPYSTFIMNGETVATTTVFATPPPETTPEETTVQPDDTDAETTAPIQPEDSEIEESSFSLPDILTIGEFIDPIYGDRAWELVQERGGVDLDYPLPYDKSLFCFDGYAFHIDSADCEVSALIGGTVEYAGYTEGYGSSVLILDENGHYWFYYHLKMNDLRVKTGNTVNAGDIIGHTGTTGYITGHLYALRVG